MSKKRKWTDEQLIAAVPESRSVFGVIRAIGLKMSGGTHALIKMRMRQLKLDTSHFSGQGWCVGENQEKLAARNRIPLEKILVRESTYQNTCLLKKRLIKAGLLINQCYECGQNAIWNDRPLSLQIDHKDGDRTNNLLENLRIICPNCHTQTTNYAGKGIGQNGGIGRRTTLKM